MPLSATNAATSETNAATSATTATTKASEAATSATNAATSATSASTAQTAAETAQTAAEAAQAAAELAADNFDDTYLGSKTSDPTVDNDGDALNAGDLYFNTTSSELKYYTGSAWVAIAPGITNVVEDTTPQLGGNLDLNSNNITGTGNIPAANLTGALPALDGSALTGVEAFPSGTLMLFQQTAAPTGWTKQTTHNNKALRVVTGTAGSGGTTNFTSALGTPSVSGSVSLSGAPSSGNLAVSISGNISNTTLTINQIPSHSHSSNDHVGSVPVEGSANGNQNRVVAVNKVNRTTNNAGNGGAHNHGHNLSGNMTGDPGVGNLAGSLSSSTAAINVQYVDLIIAAKD